MYKWDKQHLVHVSTVWTDTLRTALNVLIKGHVPISGVVLYVARTMHIILIKGDILHFRGALIEGLHCTYIEWRMEYERCVCTHRESSQTSSCPDC